jgi:hypothetical protein
MKLQFLGDARDAMKWDLLHHVMTSSAPPYRRLLFVPMPTKDKPGLSHGSLAPSSFPCRPEILAFAQDLGKAPRSFERVVGLGQLPGAGHFVVDVYQPDREIGFGWERVDYWRELLEQDHSDTLVFVDPDNGFEAPTQAGPQHLRFGEAAAILRVMPASAALAVFQYRPQGSSWKNVWQRVALGLQPAFTLTAMYGSQAGIAFFTSTRTAGRLDTSLRGYATARDHAPLHLWPGVSAAGGR